MVGARGEDGLNAAVEEIERAGSEALAVAGDVAEREYSEELVRAALDRFGRIDTFVANAIVTVYAEVEQLEPDELRRVMDVHFFGVAYGYWAALPALKESYGTFLHVSSALAYQRQAKDSSLWTRLRLLIPKG